MSYQALSRRYMLGLILTVASAPLLAGCIENNGAAPLPTGPFSIRGQAVNSLAANAPLAGFTISIAGRPDLSAVTDANGNFTIVAVPPGIPQPIRFTAVIGVLSFNSNGTFQVQNLAGSTNNVGAVAFPVPNPNVPGPPNL